MHRIFVLAMLLARGAAAQVVIGRVPAPDVGAWLRLGPTVAIEAGVTPFASRWNGGATLRLGIFGGLPLQAEFSATLREEAVDARWGLRLLPVRWTPAGEWKAGGLQGLQLGLVGGFGTIGGYLGAAVEWLIEDEVGLCVAYEYPFGGVLAAPASLTAGLKVQVPVGKEP